MKSRKILAAVMAPVCAVSAMAVVASADSATKTETELYTGTADLTEAQMQKNVQVTKKNISTAVAGDTLTFEYEVKSGIASDEYPQISIVAIGTDDKYTWHKLPKGDYDVFDLNAKNGKTTVVLSEEQAALLASDETRHVVIAGQFITLKSVKYTHYEPGADIAIDMFSGSEAFGDWANSVTMVTPNIPNAVAGDTLTFKYTTTETDLQIKLSKTANSGWTALTIGDNEDKDVLSLDGSGEKTVTLTAEQAALLASDDANSFVAQGKNITLTNVIFTHKVKKAEESSDSSDASSDSSETSSDSSDASSDSSDTTSESKPTTSESKPATSDEDKPAGDDKTDSTDKTETPGATDKADTVTNTVTVDKVLKGAELSKAVFGDSKKEWKDVETITFESDEPFAVVFDVKAGKIKGDDKATTFVKGVNELAKADLPAEAFATKWTLSKDEVAAMLEADPTGENTQIISKDGKKIQVKATVTLKADAASDDKTDNKNTGIALAVAPVILAGAAVAIVALKKRK